MRQQGPKKPIAIDWFGDKGVHADLQAAVAVGFHGIGCHGNDGEFMRGIALAQQARRSHAVHHGHLHVHEHDIKRQAKLLLLCHSIQRNLAVVGNMHLKADAAEHFVGDLLVDVVIFHQQDARTPNGFKPRLQPDSQRWQAAMG